jgi:hypothetical protein
MISLFIFAAITPRYCHTSLQIATFTAHAGFSSFSSSPPGMVIIYAGQPLSRQISQPLRLARCRRSFTIVSLFDTAAMSDCRFRFHGLPPSLLIRYQRHCYIFDGFISIFAAMIFASLRCISWSPPMIAGQSAMLPRAAALCQLVLFSPRCCRRQPMFAFDTPMFSFGFSTPLHFHFRQIRRHFRRHAASRGHFREADAARPLSHYTCRRFRPLSRYFHYTPFISPFSIRILRHERCRRPPPAPAADDIAATD